MYSEVVKSMADERGAHWLIDNIASHRANPKNKKARETDERYHDMEIWVLEDHGEEGAVLKSASDTSNGRIPDTAAVITQKIDTCDFDFRGESQYKLYCGYTSVPDGKGGQRPGFYIYHPSEY